MTTKAEIPATSDAYLRLQPDGSYTLEVLGQAGKQGDRAAGVWGMAYLIFPCKDGRKNPHLLPPGKLRCAPQRLNAGCPLHPWAMRPCNHILACIAHATSHELSLCFKDALLSTLYCVHLCPHP